MMHKTPLKKAFGRVDDRWVEAFGGKELRLNGQDGVDQFKKCLAGKTRLNRNPPLWCSPSGLRYRQVDARGPKHGIDA